MHCNNVKFDIHYLGDSGMINRTKIGHMKEDIDSRNMTRKFQAPKVCKLNDQSLKELCLEIELKVAYTKECNDLQ